MRARALQGDRLAELTDAEREWVWRSLLTGVRLELSATLAGLTHEQVVQALVQIRARYDQRIANYKLRRVKTPDLPQDALLKIGRRQLSHELPSHADSSRGIQPFSTGAASGAVRATRPPPERSAVL